MTQCVQSRKQCLYQAVFVIISRLLDAGPKSGNQDGVMVKAIHLGAHVDGHWRKAFAQAAGSAGGVAGAHDNGRLRLRGRLTLFHSSHNHFCHFSCATLRMPV